jgi:hypothetical protein
MPINQKIFAIITALVFFVIVLDLARRKKLKVEYSILWIVTGFIMFGLVLYYEALVGITRMIGAVLPTTTLFIFSILFLMFLNLHFSVKVSHLSEQVKNLAQEVSLRSVKKSEPAAEQEATEAKKQGSRVAQEEEKKQEFV